MIALAVKIMVAEDASQLAAAALAGAMEDGEAKLAAEQETEVMRRDAVAGMGARGIDEKGALGFIEDGDEGGLDVLLIDGN